MCKQASTRMQLQESTVFGISLCITAPYPVARDDPFSAIVASCPGADAKNDEEKKKVVDVEKASRRQSDASAEFGR